MSCTRVDGSFKGFNLVFTGKIKFIAAGIEDSNRNLAHRQAAAGFQSYCAIADAEDKVGVMTAVELGSLERSRSQMNFERAAAAVVLCAVISHYGIVTVARRVNYVVARRTGINFVVAGAAIQRDIFTAIGNY